MLAFSLVADVNQINLGREPTELVQAGENYFFIGADSSGNEKLWLFDPATETSTILKDVESNADCFCSRELHVIGDRIAFAFTTVNEEDRRVTQLWASDGTDEGTFPIRDINYGRKLALHVIGDEVYFQVSQIRGEEGLWKSDGTMEGTSMLTGVEADNIFDLEGTGVFFARDPETRMEMLWTTDGTAVGTVPVADVPRPRQPDQALIVGNRLVYAAETAEFGSELWVVDGTVAGSRMVRDIVPGPRDSSPESLHVSADGSTVLFSATATGSGRELWRTDGSVAGTIMVREIFDGSGSSRPEGFWNLGEFTYFAARTPDAGNELWRTDGTTEGTFRVKDINPGAASSDIQPIGNIEDSFVFLATGSSGRQIWKTDGTEAGTVFVTAVSGDLGAIEHRAEFDGHVGFTASDSRHGREIWITDGTAAGTFVADIRPGQENSNPSQLQGIDGKLYFTANNGTSGPERYISNGTLQGTRLVEDLNSGTLSARPILLGQLPNGTYLFLADDGIHGGRELWAADVAGRATFLRNFSGGANDTYIKDFAFFDDRMYFSPNGQGLWVTDGKVEGTQRLSRMGIGNANSNGSNIVVVGNDLYFTSFDTSGQQQLWVSDGTLEGSRVLAAIGDMNIRLQMRELKGLAMFNASDATHGEELWITDGTLEGTRLVKDIHPGSEGSRLTEFAVSQGKLYFLAHDGATFSRLWTSDGTPEGTTKVFDDLVFGIAATADLVYFVAHDGIAGNELWRTDGTSAGTFLVKDINPSGGSAINLFHMVELNGVAYFYADDGFGKGLELWRTTGTRSTTEKVRDIIPHADERSYLRVWNGRLVIINGPRDNESLYVSDGTVAGTRPVDTAPYSFRSVIDIDEAGRGVFVAAVVIETGSEVFIVTSDVESSPQISDYTYNDGDTAGSSLDSLAFTFNTDVSASLRPDDLYLSSVARRGAHVDTSTATFRWDEATRTAHWDLSALSLGYDAYIVELGRNLIYDEHNNRLDGNSDGINGDVFRRSVSTAIPGDADLNGTVDFADFLVLSADFGKTRATWSDGDFNSDGVVNFPDFLLLSASFGRSATQAFAIDGDWWDDPA